MSGAAGGMKAADARLRGLPFGRVQIDAVAHDCLFDGEAVVLLDRPAYETAAHCVGEAALADCTILAPVVPSKVVAVGLNYRAHAAEFSLAVPDEPVIFLKPPSSVIGHGGAIVCPPKAGRVDYEAELAVIVGRISHRLEPDAAAGVIAGYTCANDVTARHLQKRDGQWTRAKGFDTFCPLGPWAVRHAPSASARIRTIIGETTVQEGVVGDMIMRPTELLAFVSGVMTLYPGDVILTGTPPGVGPISPGQQVTIAVDEVGQLTSRVD